MNTKTDCTSRTGVLLSLLIIHASLCTCPAEAQEADYRTANTTQLWRLTDNAAGLGFDNSDDRGYAEFSVQHQSGSYHRVQEGGQQNELLFTTERYQHIGAFLVGYGRFQFQQNRTKDRAWCDVMRPYNSNPFFGGSSFAGKYDTQAFDLSAALSTIPIPLAGTDMDRELTLGVRLDYKVGDLSRLRDPRSRSELLDYRLSPSVVYAFGNHRTGVSGFYHRRKEKIPNITTVQTDPNLMYYQMTGLEHASGLVGGYSGYNREWVNHEFGAQLNYQYQKGAVNSLTSASLSRGSENVYGTYKYEPGHYTSFVYQLTSHNRITTGSLIHQADLDVTYNEDYADEYRQQLIQERDANNGYTSYRYETQIEYKKRYQVRVLDAALHYRTNILQDEKVSAYGGLRLSLLQVKNRYLLPQSDLKYNHFNIQLEGGKAFLGNRLWIDIAGTWHLSSKAELNLADATTAYAQQVLLPDMDYYRADFWQGHLEAKYLFPMRIKGFATQWYVKAWADYLRTSQTVQGCHLDRKTVGLSLGLFN